MRRLALLLTALAAAGCGGSGTASPDPVVVEGGEYAFAAPGEMEGGLVSLRFVNTGDEPHELALGRIGEGNTLDEAVAALDEGDDVPWLEDVGGVPLLWASVEDFERWIEGGQEGVSPLTFLGAMQSFPSGSSVFVMLELEAGRTYRLEDDPGGLPPVEIVPR